MSAGPVLRHLMEQVQTPPTGSIFEVLKTAVEADGYFLTDPKTLVKHKVYSLKSLAREARTLTVTIEKCIKAGKTLLWIAPYHEEILAGLDENLRQNLVWISPASFTPPSAALSTIITGDEGLQYFIREITPQDSFSIEAHNVFSAFGLRDFLLGKILDILKNSAVRLKTIAHFANRWQVNFQKNRQKWLALPDVSTMTLAQPDVLVLGGPSVDLHIHEIRGKKIWCADTALPTLLSYAITPDCVFSLDAGHGSYEHFITAIDRSEISRTTLVVDPLSFSPLFDLGFQKTYTCANTNPLVQETKNPFTIIKNQTDDVCGFIWGVYNLLFEKTDESFSFDSTKNFPGKKDLEKKRPLVFGHDRGHIRKATHLRGSAYHRRQYFLSNRLATPELYFYRLSSRYSRS